MSVKTIGRNVHFGTAGNVSGNLNAKEDAQCVKSNTGAKNTGVCENFKGLSTVPITVSAVTGTEAFGAAGAAGAAIGATGIFSAMYAAIKSGLINSKEHVKNGVKNAPQNFSKNMPKILHVV